MITNVIGGARMSQSLPRERLRIDNLKWVNAKGEHSAPTAPPLSQADRPHDHHDRKAKRGYEYARADDENGGVHGRFRRLGLWRNRQVRHCTCDSRR